MLRPFKYVVQAIVLEEDADGAIIGERRTEPEVFYSADEAQAWLAAFGENLARAEVVGR